MTGSVSVVWGGMIDGRVVTECDWCWGRVGERRDRYEVVQMLLVGLG